MRRGEYERALGTFASAAAKDLGHAADYLGPAIAYQALGKMKEAQEILEKGIALKPKAAALYIALGSVFQRQAKFAESEEPYRKALAVKPGYSKAYAGLGLSYQGQRQFGKAQAERSRARAEEFRLKTYVPTGLKNYLRLKELLDRRGIRLAAMQYPMRSVDSLKKLLAGHDAGVVFIDNRKIFQDAVRENGYETYFIDMFAGDFGHATYQGNRLLAEHVADVLLGEVFRPGPPQRAGRMP